MTDTNQQVRDIAAEKYRYGFETAIVSDTAPKGLNEDIIRFMTIKVDEFTSSKNEEETAAVEAAN